MIFGRLARSASYRSIGCMAVGDGQYRYCMVGTREFERKNDVCCQV